MAKERFVMTTGFKIANSLWIVMTLIPLGLTTYCGFFFIGIRANQRKWLISGFVYLVIVMSSFYFISETFEDHILNDIFVWVLLGGWVASVVHAASIRQQYLNIIFERRVAYQRGLNTIKERKVVDPKSLERSKSSRKNTLDHTTSNQEKENPIVNPTIININKATEEEIRALPSIHPFLAKSILQARHDVGQFESIEHLAMVVNIQPHIFSKCKDYIAFTDDIKTELEAKANHSKQDKHTGKQTGRMVDY